MDKVIFTMHGDKETKGTFRFEEEVGSGDNVVIGSLYIKKSTFAHLGGKSPERIQVTIEDAPDD